jgi:predicted transcriptional regulator YheO
VTVMAQEFDFKSYIHLVDFLGACLGPYTEVVLYSFSDINESVIAICNAGISGIELGDPLTSFAINAMKDKGKVGPPYYLNHLTHSKSNKPLRSNSFLILDKQGNPKGMFTTHTDVTHYKQAANLLEMLAYLPEQSPSNKTNSQEELGNQSPVEMIKSIVNEVTHAIGVSPDRMTTMEKTEIVNRLNQEGFFLIKGAVSQVAAMIGSSEATVYRYLSRLNKIK